MKGKKEDFFCFCFSFFFLIEEKHGDLEKATNEKRETEDARERAGS